jgi:hypothetical protein
MQLAETPSGGSRLAFAVVLPLALLAIAYAMWAISDRLLVIGPFDRAAFGWTFVMPLAWLTPGVTGLLWAGLSRRDRWLAAGVLATILTGVAGALLANATDSIGCAPVTSWTEDLPRALVVGVVIAVGPAGGGLFAAWAAERTGGCWRPVAAIAAGAAVGAVSLFAALLVFAVTFVVGVSCAPVLL